MTVKPCIPKHPLSSSIHTSVLMGTSAKAHKLSLRWLNTFNTLLMWVPCVYFDWLYVFQDEEKHKNLLKKNNPKTWGSLVVLQNVKGALYLNQSSSDVSRVLLYNHTLTYWMCLLVHTQCYSTFTGYWTFYNLATYLNMLKGLSFIKCLQF